MLYSHRWRGRSSCRSARVGTGLTDWLTNCPPSLSVGCQSPAAKLNKLFLASPALDPLRVERRGATFTSSTVTCSTRNHKQRPPTTHPSMGLIDPPWLWRTEALLPAHRCLSPRETFSRGNRRSFRLPVPFFEDATSASFVSDPGATDGFSLRRSKSTPHASARAP